MPKVLINIHGYSGGKNKAGYMRIFGLSTSSIQFISFIVTLVYFILPSLYYYMDCNTIQEQFLA
jgi:hypothetical protein